ncbi:MAG: phosphotransferase, partial [Brachybacterium sp.]|nr:phosphotransferase [Brachybacterium sp.]
PGASVLVSYSAEDPSGTGAPGAETTAVGWALLVDSRDKRENVLRRAARLGPEVREHPLPSAAPTAAGPSLLSGGLDSDPRLGSEIERVRRRHGGAAAARVLSYNPGRHAVLLLPGTGEVLRVSARSLDPLLQVATLWRELDLPTLDQRRWRDRPTVLVGRQWGHGDLAALASHPQSMSAAARLGGIIARLHAAEVSPRALPAARIGALVPATSEAVSDLLPHRAAQIDRLSARLHGALRDEEPRALIHGDLSPDQVLVSVDETAVPGEGRLPLRVVDLDRSGLGPAGVDLGSWIASCLLAGTEEQAAAFLGGYARRRALPPADELAAWTARALLAAALDPMRRYREDWLPAVEQRLALAETVLDRPERLPLPAAAAAPESATAQAPPLPVAAPAPGAAAEAEPLVPARFEHRGRSLTVRRAWADDGRGLPLELCDDAAGTGEAPLRAARLDATTGRVTVFEPGTDPRLPGLARALAAHTGAVVVSHRPGKRAVVRTRDDHGTVRYVKIVRPGRAQRLLDAIARAEDFTGPFRTAEVLAADEDTVTFAALPGHLLHDGLPVADGTWRRAWRESREAWSAAVEGSRRRLATARSGADGAR